MPHTDLIKRLSRADEYDPVGHDAWEAAAAITDLHAENQRLCEALAWYGEQARLARLIHSEGDAGRRNLEADGGSRARAALRNTEAP